MIDYFRTRLKQNKLYTVFLCVAALFCVTMAVYFAVNGMFRNMALALLCCLIFVVGYPLGEYITKLRFSPVFAALLALLVIGGMILGPGLDFYFKFPQWDTVLHTSSGLMFTCLGYAFADKFVADNAKHRKALCLCVGVSFSLAIALLWEMIEYAGTTFFRTDMQEDSVIYNIKSYLLAGSHNDIVEINDIKQTIINYGDGQTLVIDGYLDVGLSDTLNDMLVCLVGSILLPVVFAVSKLLGKTPDKFFVPQSFENSQNDAHAQRK